MLSVERSWFEILALCNFSGLAFTVEVMTSCFALMQILIAEQQSSASARRIMRMQNATSLELGFETNFFLAPLSSILCADFYQKRMAAIKFECYINLVVGNDPNWPAGHIYPTPTHQAITHTGLHWLGFSPPLSFFYMCVFRVFAQRDFCSHRSHLFWALQVPSWPVGQCSFLQDVAMIFQIL